MRRLSKFAPYSRLNPRGIGKNISAADLIEETFLAYNGGRLREAAKLLTEKMLPKDGVIGMSVTGALTPAGVGKSCLIPLLRAGFVDWVVATGANLYHDLHYGLDMALYRGSPFLDDVTLRRDGVIRIYDILFDYNVLLDTDAFVRKVIQGPEFQRPMGTDEFHYHLGKYVSERGRQLKQRDNSVLAAAYECGIVAVGDARARFSVRFYMVAMLFILFDVEVVFMLPWAVIYRKLPAITGQAFFGFWEMLVYLGFVGVGLYYIVRKGILNWSQDKADL